MCVRISRTLTITEEKIKQYAFLSGDFNQIHLDQKEAERYKFKEPIAHGMLTMGLTLEIASSFTEKGMRISKYEMQFLKPIFQNDLIHIVAEKKKQDYGSIYLEITGRKQNELVVKGELTLEDRHFTSRKFISE
ncbi:MaoC family dehydratase [Peribacillus loiseleuriae]|uniref:MaoC family dehydratase n=1 Tax=Peribacillus loiseleuriae TaxID=1679170 RepID=UPI00380C20DB